LRDDPLATTSLKYSMLLELVGDSRSHTLDAIQHFAWGMESTWDYPGRVSNDFGLISFQPKNPND